VNAKYRHFSGGNKKVTPQRTTLSVAVGYEYATSPT
jgi:hypothetical protein